VLKKDLGVDVQSAYIVPISDTHMGSPAFDDSLFFKKIKWILDTPNAYCVLNGDIIEMNSKGSVGDVFEGLRPREQRRLAVKYLEPLAKKGKILAYLDGNHERRASKDTDEYIGEEICYSLGIPSVYSPDGIFLYLSVGYDRAENKRARNVYTIYMLHGWTSARTIGGKFNNLASMASIVIADIYIASHTHQQGVFPLDIYSPDIRTKKLNQKTQLFVSTGSFMKYAGYSVRAGFRPSTPGTPYIELSGVNKEYHAVV
jgi:predicted phosphodiesterase